MFVRLLRISFGEFSFKMEVSFNTFLNIYHASRSEIYAIKSGLIEFHNFWNENVLCFQ